MQPSPFIHVKGASQNNLKSLDLDIPLNRITVITGVSGSGKSSLAFDTLYAEGQRRYVETFSPYARQFMDRMDRPRVDRIDGIPPAIAIDRKDPVRTSRSTVGTMTEVTDYAKLLYARYGRLHCRRCGQPVAAETPGHVWERIRRLRNGSELLLTFPAAHGDPDTRKALIQMGFDRFFDGRRIGQLADLPPGAAVEPLNVIADRLPLQKADARRIVDSAELAFRFGNGRIDVWLDGAAAAAFSNRLECAACGIAYPPAPPNLFSFNSPIGACETCRGFGRVIDVDMDLVIPDPRLSLAQGAVKPWGTHSEHRPEFDDLMDFCRKTAVPTDRPFNKLKKRQRQAVIDGTPDYYGVRGFFRWLETKTYKMPVRVFLSRYRSYDRCPQCRGTRFKPDTLLYRIDGKTIADVYAMNVAAAADFFHRLPLNKGDEAGRLILEEVNSRLRYLKDVGLGYLTLDRQSRSLSGGEVQRAALASALGASLVNTLYILDEPSIGLHPRDSHRLIGILKRLRDLANTVVVVEHDPEIIRESDYLLDLGPGAGAAGGQVMYFGPTAGVNGSLTGQYLKGARKIPVPARRVRPPRDRWLTVKGAAANNLKHIQLRLPLGRFTCLTGVSGSGKSTLAEDVLYRSAKRHFGEDVGKPGACGPITGLQHLADCVLVDQRPIGRTPRANLLTYTKALDPIRRLLALTEAAREKGFGPGHFSFNVDGGRCETCRGDGFEKVEMQFLSDVFISCPACNGKRFKEAVLAVAYRGRSIHDILCMTVDEALGFFDADSRPHAEVRRALQPLVDVGLGYLPLGQPLNTLSGGEAQRLKLSRYVGLEDARPHLFIFDEPTTGLHFDDIAVLLNALQRLVDRGHTLLVIEHNMDVVKTADWVVDLGPEGGEQGGSVLAAGTPEAVAACPSSHTGRHLEAYLAPGGRLKTAGRLTARTGQTGNGHQVIALKGAREHNLKNLSLTLPHHRLVAFTGVSGSGKSTLAFDILFAEGQRRYLECLAPYVRQYVRVLERPDVDVLSGLSPTVAIEQRISHSGRRSTVATLTEIYHFLRLLFSKLGTPHCPGCGRALAAQTATGILEEIRQRQSGRLLRILAPKVAGRKGFHRDVLNRALKNGFGVARIDGTLTPLTPDMALSRYHEHTIDLVVGEMAGRRPGRRWLAQRIAVALEEGGGSLIVLDARDGETVYSVHGTCPACGIGVDKPDPRLFSFNSHLGACPACNGLGTAAEGAGPAHACATCGGSRLKAAALAVKIQEHSIWDLVRQPADQLHRFLQALRFAGQRQAIAEPIIREIGSRLELFNRLGLSYLPLSRSGDTLSGGEAQRVRLAAQLGSNLTGVCYILDEPTIGLHPRDNRVLIDALKALRDRGNTVLVVEHDEDTVRAADLIVDLGPGAGHDGGRVVAQGSLADLKKSPESVTGAFLNGCPRPITSRRRPYRKALAIDVRGASARNLKGIDVRFPLGTLTCVTGVSGSGKSSLLKETLYKGLRNRLAHTGEDAGPCRDISGWQSVSRVLEVDHSPIGRTPRSVPASYVGFLDEIRRLFAATPDARARGYAPGRFSFNIDGGRCDACKGQGLPKVEMSFLPDVYVPCEVCDGRRFNRDTLAVRYKGRSIAEVLDMTFEEARAFFSTVPAIRRGIGFVCDIGLSYLRLGQPSPTLSGGEAQRIKIARQLVKPSAGHSLYIMDEPTTGLHLSDVQRLIGVLQALVDAGNTVTVIEHNLEVIKAADYIVDLGPEGGDAGGRVVAAGAPDEVLAAAGTSHTARHLQRSLAAAG